MGRRWGCIPPGLGRADKLSALYFFFAAAGLHILPGITKLDW